MLNSPQFQINLPQFVSNSSQFGLYTPQFGFIHHNSSEFHFNSKIIYLNSPEFQQFPQFVRISPQFVLNLPLTTRINLKNCKNPINQKTSADSLTKHFIHSLSCTFHHNLMSTTYMSNDSIKNRKYELMTYL